MEVLQRSWKKIFKNHRSGVCLTPNRFYFAFPDYLECKLKEVCPVGVSWSIMKSMRNESTGTVMMLPQRMDPDRTRGRWWGEGWCLSQATTLREPSPPPRSAVAGCSPGHPGPVLAVDPRSPHPDIPSDDGPCRLPRAQVDVAAPTETAPWPEHAILARANFPRCVQIHPGVPTKVVCLSEPPLRIANVLNEPAIPQ